MTEQQRLADFVPRRPHEYRDKCLKEKGDNCWICETDRDVVVHHIDGDKTNNKLSNLIPVCNSCHTKIHAGSEGYEDYHEQLPPESKIGEPSNRATPNGKLFEARVHQDGAVTIPKDLRRKHDISRGDGLIIEIVVE
jgi:hypothetical protein